MSTVRMGAVGAVCASVHCRGAGGIELAVSATTSGSVVPGRAMIRPTRPFARERSLRYWQA